VRSLFKSSHRFATNINPRRSLRTRLGLAIGSIAFVLSILASVIVGHTVSEQIKVNVGQELAELAYQMTDKLDRGMFERYRDLQIISTLNAIRDSKAPVSEKRSLLEKLQSTYTDYAWIGLADNQGIVQVSTQKLLEGKNISQRPWFIEGQKAPYVGDVHDAVKLAQLLPHPSQEPLRFVDVAVPVVDSQGNQQGVLGAHLSWAWSHEIQTSLLGSVNNRHQEMFIFSRNGDLLLGSKRQLSKQKSLSLASLKAAQSGLNSYLIETWSDNNSYLTGFAHSTGYRNYPGLGWLVLVRQKTEVAFAPAWQLQQQIFIWNMSLGSFFALLGWFVANQITNPLLAIASAAESIRQGDNHVKIPVLQGKDEIANLSKSLRRLVYTLTQQENDLKDSNEQLQSELFERLRVEEFLRQSEEKFRQLAENIPEVFWITDPKITEIIYISPAYAQVWGSPCERLYTHPQSWLEVIHPNDRELVISNLENSPREVSIQYRLMHPDGSIRWIWDHSFPIRNLAGEVYRIARLAQDITEHKQMEETRLALKHERELSELKSRFIAIASHEFRTPLTAILMSTGMLETYSEQLPQEKRQKYYQHIKLAIKRLTQLLDDILVLGRAEAGKLEFNPVPLNLTEFCWEIVQDHQMNAGEQYEIKFINQYFFEDKSLNRFSAETGELEEFPLIDENLLRHILTNLLSNAIKYSPQGGLVQFHLISDQKSITFRIQDQGIGIPAEDLENLFTSFYRCSNTGKVPGTGLGLTIVKEAAELHGGQVTVESEVGVGTTFTVVLPLIINPTP